MEENLEGGGEIVDSDHAQVTTGKAKHATVHGKKSE